MEDRRHARLATNELAGSGSCRRSRDPLLGLRGSPREPLPTRVDGLPDLPPAYDATLERGLEQLGLRLDGRQRAAIDMHVRLLRAWNAATNLTAIVEPAAVATHHVLDSLTAVDALRRRSIAGLLDLGSGGGFPGIPLALTVPVRRALLVESIGRKASFLSAAAGAVVTQMPGLRLEVVADRAERLARDPEHRGRWPAVTARAVASLGELIELAFPLLDRGGCLVAWKRGDIDRELAAAARAVAALGGGALEVVDVGLPSLAGNRLVVATRTGAVPASYPREPARRKRQPW